MSWIEERAGQRGIKFTQKYGVVMLQDLGDIKTHPSWTFEKMAKEWGVSSNSLRYNYRVIFGDAPKKRSRQPQKVKVISHRKARRMNGKTFLAIPTRADGYYNNKAQPELVIVRDGCIFTITHSRLFDPVWDFIGPIKGLPS